jgi:hypothetical protein
MNSHKEWYTVCSENNIVLSQCDDTHDFKITFSVLEKYENIVEIIQQNKLFELIQMLNEDIIEKCSENIVNNNNNVVLKLNTKDLNINNNIYNNLVIVLNYSKTIDNNLYRLISVDSTDTKVSNNEIHLKQFALLLSNNKSKTNFDITYTLANNNIKNLNVSEKFISLYLKKLFYRLKQYFD